MRKKLFALYSISSLIDRKQVNIALQAAYNGEKNSVVSQSNLINFYQAFIIYRWYNYTK